MIADKKRKWQQATQSLNTRIEIWDPTGATVKDELGADKLVPALFTRVWGDVEMIRGREVKEDGRIYPYAYYRVTIRYRDDLQPDMYLVINDSQYNIESIKDQFETGHYLELSCVERVMAYGEV